MYDIQMKIKKVEDELFNSVEVVVNNYYSIELRRRSQEAIYIKARMMLIVISYGYGFTFQRIGEYLGYSSHCQPRYFYKQYNEIKDIYPEYKIDLTSIMSVLFDVLKD